MKSPLTKNQLVAILSGICLLIPIAYADPDFSNLSSIEQVDRTYSNTDFSSTDTSNRSDDVQITQLGNYNEAVVDINGDSNQLSLNQQGNRNNGDIQIEGDSNKLAASQNGNALSFDLKIEGDNRAYTLTQEKR